jgi:glycosyltransferase involved in cell wall biosynthesis
MNLVPVPERYRKPLKNIVWHQFVLPRWLREHTIDVLHVPSYRRMLHRAACAKVATIHDLGQFHVAKKCDWARMLYARVVARHLAQCQDEIVAISKCTARDIEHLFRVAPERIHLAYNGLDHERFVPGDSTQDKTEVAKRWKLDRPFFLYVSVIAHPQKNHVRLIEAFNRFKAATNMDWQLVLVGSDWVGSEAVHSEAQRSPFSDEIRFLGFVEDAALPTLYRAAEVMVCPSLFEGFGFPPVEAMACGCPVLCSTRGSLPEVVGNAAGTFDPEDIRQIVAALQHAATDMEWRGQLRAAGFVNAQRFNWSDHVERVLQVYEDAIERHQSSRSQNLPFGLGRARLF